jgi:hypothetical protein
MTTFSHIGKFMPDYSKYLDGKDASSCIKKMLKKKEGKVLVKFFEQAVARKEWRKDIGFRQLFDAAVKKSDRLSDKLKERFRKAETVFKKKVGEKAKEQEKSGKPSAKDAKQELSLQDKFMFDEESYQIVKKTKLAEFLGNVIKRMVGVNSSLSCRLSGVLVDAKACALELGKAFAKIYLKSNNKVHFSKDDYPEFKKYVLKEFREDLVKKFQERFNDLKPDVIKRAINARNQAIADIEYKETRYRKRHPTNPIMYNFHLQQLLNAPKFDEDDHSQEVLDRLLPLLSSELENDLDKYKVNLQYNLSI